MQSLFETLKYIKTNTPITYRTALICASAFLTCLGLLSIYASSSIPAAQNTGSEFYYVQKQALVALLGFFLIFATGHIPFHWIERLTLPLLVVSIILLFLVHIPGLAASAKGATRWIALPGFTVQPSEIAKLAFILFLAKNLSRKRSDLEDFRSGLLPNLFVFSVFAILLMLQPDFGSVALLLCLAFVMMFVGGLPMKYIFLFCLFALLGVAGAIASAPYRLARLMIYLDPWAEARNGGFQIIQSYLGFQNGGFWGAGLGESRQKLFFLPEAHTDFILSVIGEELGLLGVILICAAFAYIVYLGLKITFFQEQNYRRFLAFGLTSLVGFQATLNMGVTMGVLPTKGMTLPFVSNGANSLLVFLFAIAILARIGQEIPRRKDSEAIFG